MSLQTRMLWRRLAVALLSIAAPLLESGAESVHEIVVTSQRRAEPLLRHAGNIERIGKGTLERVQHQHMHELLTRVAGVWLSRGSGQEHLTAIRSPVLTGPGSCGAYLFLEDGIPIRPAGFCNVNSLFEVNSEMARAVEVIRGPGNALYGSNALHGIVNVLMPVPGDDFAPELTLETGANDFRRVSAGLPFDPAASWLATLLYADDGGFRDDSGYRQGKLHFKRRWSWQDGDATAALTWTGLDQETAGFILGRDSYEDPSVNRSNPNPEAFRNAESVRVYAILARSLRGIDIDLRPYLRHSDMTFLQHFLPGQPLEENGHHSAGVMAAAVLERGGRTTTLGIDVDWSDVFLRQTQAAPTEGSAFLRETRPAGKHYDYAVRGLGVAGYVQSEFDVTREVTLGAGLRLDHLRYDYDNRIRDGNTRDDGTECGFGGCLYSRPADRTDSFTNLAPKLSVSYQWHPGAQLYAVLARGFRAPQATELYRLQSGQQVADLDSERIDSLELGLRTGSSGLSADIALFAMAKRDSVFRDAEGFNVSGARTRHRGLEVALDWRLSTTVQMTLAASYAAHTYDFNTVAARGESFRRGRDVDTAPRLLGSLEFLFMPREGVDIGLQITSIGEYYLDAENRFRYPGHVLANLSGGADLTDRVRLTLRLNNVADRDIADRADFAFGNYRYFPGRGRELFAEIRYSPRREAL